jgi:hypothetical protein
VSIWVEELFDAGTKLMNVGYDALETHLVDTFDIQAAAVDNVDDDGHADAGAFMCILSPTARAIEIYVDAAASSTGKVYVVVHYIQADTEPA